ncbi:MAG: ribosome maturation factor RimM [Burkholderiales bacterium]|nr:ribosome maturation factor RimM [Burkholderiales bacterium]
MADAGWPADALEVGRIGDAWGLKGWFKVLSYASPPEALLSARRWHLQAGHQAPAVLRLPGVLEIREVREHGDGIVAFAAGIDDRTAAEALRGARIFVPRSSFPKAGADEFYWADLIGLAVVSREGVALGDVVGLIDTGPHSVLRVAPPGAAAAAEERLIPFVAAYVDTVDLAARKIVVDWGLDF